MAELKTPSIEEMAEEITNEVLDRFEYKGMTIRQWADKITGGEYAPVVHGHWIICSDGYYPYCSRCKEEPSGRKMTKYCDHCGAKMDEEA